MASEKKTIKGGCHCGHIRYTCSAAVNIDPSSGQAHLSATRCNCTFCQKLSSTNLQIDNPSEDFKLLSPPAGTEDENVGNYAPRVKTLRRHFCKTCGVHVWMEGYFEHEGHKHGVFKVNLATVDQPQEGVDLSLTKMGYWDMLNGNIAAGLRDKPWPGGLV